MDKQSTLIPPMPPLPPIHEGSHVHMIGIGGAGMSAVARILLQRGVTVSGSDRQLNDITHALQREGATVYEGHAAENLAGADVVFVTSAAKDENPEIVAARAANVPILARREFFRYLLPGKTQIAVAGTHGKTTTTAMIVHLLRETGRDPSYIVGGTMLNTGHNAHVGSGSAFVIEADEYGGMFLGLTPQIAVITNIEHDHPDNFPTMDDVLNTFRQFAALLPDDGTLVACADNPHTLALSGSTKKPVITYGIDNPHANWRATIDAATESETVFGIHALDGEQIAIARIMLPGKHNVLDALAALAAVYADGVPLDASIPALATFKGTGRRFEVMGAAGGVTVISDYGHHPTKIRVTLEAARQRYPHQPIWAVWQPHTYSRTRLLADEFAHAFSDATHVLITDIFAARESVAPDDPSPADLAKMIQSAKAGDARYSGDLSATAALLEREVQPGDVVLIFSAGDAPQIGDMLLHSLRNRAGGEGS